MDRRTMFGLVAALAAAPGAAAGTQALRRGRFTIAVDDLRVFCEVRGQGPLIVLLNGMWLKSFTDHFGTPLMAALARDFTVLTFDPRGQGRTTTGNGAITYGRFASDAVAVLDALGIGDAHFIGHSDGGTTQLVLLIDHPDRVRSATLIGTPYAHASYCADTQALFTRWYADMRRGVPVAMDAEAVALKAAYEAVSPQPAQAMAMLEARRACWSTEPNLSLRQLTTIRRPVLVFDAGKDEYIPPEQFRALADAIPDARRVSVPDLTHHVTPFAERIANETAAFVRGLAVLS